MSLTFNWITSCWHWSLQSLSDIFLLFLGVFLFTSMSSSSLLFSSVDPSSLYECRGVAPRFRLAALLLLLVFWPSWPLVDELVELRPPLPAFLALLWLLWLVTGSSSPLDASSDALFEAEAFLVLLLLLLRFGEFRFEPPPALLRRRGFKSGH